MRRDKEIKRVRAARHYLLLLVLVLVLQLPLLACGRWLIRGRGVRALFRRLEHSAAPPSDAAAKTFAPWDFFCAP